MPSQKEVVTYLALNVYDISDDIVNERLHKEFGVNLDDANDDQLEDLQLKLLALSKKKSSKKAIQMVATPTGAKPIASALPTATNFLMGQVVRHTKCPEWGVGEILCVSVYNTDELLQKLTIMFKEGGIRTIIVRPGMLETV